MCRGRAPIRRPHTAATGDAGCLEALLVVVEVLRIGYLEPEVVEPVGRLVGTTTLWCWCSSQHFMKTREESRAVVDHADDLGVVGGRELEVRHAELDVGDSGRIVVGVHSHEAFVELALVVEDGATDVVLGPGDEVGKSGSGRWSPPVKTSLRVPRGSKK